MNNGILILIGVAVVAAIVFFLRQRKSAEGESHTATDSASATNANANAAPLGTDSDADQRVLEQLRAAGSDLSKPHDLEFYLYFPTEEAASRVAGKIRSDGFNVEVKLAAQGSAWLCYATKRMVPERNKIVALGKRFRAFAQEFDGEYDGWETSIVK